MISLTGEVSIPETLFIASALILPQRFGLTSSWTSLKESTMNLRRIRGKDYSRSFEASGMDQDLVGLQPLLNFGWQF